MAKTDIENAQDTDAIGVVCSALVRPCLRIEAALKHADVLAPTLAQSWGEKTTTKESNS